MERTNDPTVCHLHEKIQKLKASRKWEVRFMKFEELLKQSRQEGVNEGRSEGQERILRLIGLMSKSGEVEQVARLEKEPEFLKRMFAKYCL